MSVHELILSMTGCNSGTAHIAYRTWYILSGFLILFQLRPLCAFRNANNPIECAIYHRYFYREFRTERSAVHVVTNPPRGLSHESFSLRFCQPSLLLAYFGFFGLSSACVLGWRSTADWTSTLAGELSFQVNEKVIFTPIIAPHLNQIPFPPKLFS